MQKTIVDALEHKKRLDALRRRLHEMVARTCMYRMDGRATFGRLTADDLKAIQRKVEVAEHPIQAAYLAMSYHAFSVAPHVEVSEALNTAIYEAETLLAKANTQMLSPNAKVA